MSRRPWAARIAATLGVAALVHLGTTWELPRLIMRRALARMGAPNAMHFAARPDETFRRVVRPSPDLLYSACPFDLSKGPLRVTAHVPHSTYWSVSAFDAATDNFFVRNDRQIAGDSIEIVAVRPGMALPPPGAATEPGAVDARERVIVVAPTGEGLFLLRLLVNDEKDLGTLDAIRRQASCATIPSQPSVR